MSTHFSGEGNIGSPPEYREFPNGNDEPSRLLRLNVYFDNPVPKKDGTFEDRGGFWAPVEIWHRDAEHWKDLYQKGMRVLVIGRMEREPWEDKDEKPRETWQINARSVGILPYRIESVTLSTKPASAGSRHRRSRRISRGEPTEARSVFLSSGSEVPPTSTAFSRAQRKLQYTSTLRTPNAPGRICRRFRDQSGCLHIPLVCGEVRNIQTCCCPDTSAM